MSKAVPNPIYVLVVYSGMLLPLAFAPVDGVIRIVLITPCVLEF